MKIIHCADLHLDSKMTANLDKNRAKERRAEILRTFENMVEYAATHEISAIIIAGDLFDTKNISVTTRRAVENAIKDNPEIDFYYLKGNHDVDNFLSSMEEIPNNLMLFGEDWTHYPMDKEGKIVLTGLELNKDNSAAVYSSLFLDREKFNIVTLHGQEAASASKDKAEVINLNALKNKGIDYLALGHVHAYKKEKLDNQGIYCYSGCLEGRGFDECGDHGFVLLNIDPDSHAFTSEFVPFAGRKLYEVEVDITDAMTTAEVAGIVKDELDSIGISDKQLVKIVLTGGLDIEAELDLAYLLKRFEPDFYFLKIYNHTKRKVNAEDYALEASLKGEFVRMVLGDDSLTEDDKANIIMLGLQALNGEEIG